jgi:hypothetical protein
MPDDLFRLLIDHLLASLANAPLDCRSAANTANNDTALSQENRA